MPKYNSLTQLQEEIIKRIIALPQNGPRSAGYKLTLGNRKSRGIGAACTFYNVQVGNNWPGHTPEQLIQQWRDIQDIVRLRLNARTNEE